MSQFVLPKLDYAMDALAPVMSEETLKYHYGKHHQSYVNNLNNLIKGTRFEELPLREIIETSQGAIFNNASQTYNHAFFWKCLTPNGGGEPTGALLQALVKKWGSFDGFKEAFIAMAASNFGSGWTWLVMRADGELDILNTSNAGSPLTQHLKPLLVVDVWEHAYYIDTRNDRGAYLKSLFAKLVNWSFVEKRFNGEPFECECKACSCGCAA